MRTWGKVVRGTMRGSGVEIKAKDLAKLGEMQEDKYISEVLSGPHIGKISVYTSVLLNWEMKQRLGVVDP